MTYKRITPGCCDKSEIHKTPYLSLFCDRLDSGLLSDSKPKWCVKSIDLVYDREFESHVEVNFCPFCGSKTPDIELNKDISDEIYDTDSGDYCNTCDERSMCCECLPPEFRWKVVN